MCERAALGEGLHKLHQVFEKMGNELLPVCELTDLTAFVNSQRVKGKR